MSHIMVLPQPRCFRRKSCHLSQQALCCGSGAELSITQGLPLLSHGLSSEGIDNRKHSRYSLYSKTLVSRENVHELPAPFVAWSRDWNSHVSG
jgi:hypothetical protein